MIIDVDAHGEPPAELIRAVQQEVGISEENIGESTLRFVAGDLLATAPRETWPTLDALRPPGSRAIAGLERVEGFAYEEAKQHGVADPARRIAWMDEIGIDYQNVIALAGVTATRFMEDRDRARQIIAACNRAMAESHDGYTDRLWPTTTLEWTDLDAAIAEMTSMRSRGSRSFLVNATPVNGIPHFHSAFDRVWSAAVDLGMLPILHVGMNPTVFAPGWTEVEGDMVLLRQLGVCQGHQSVQVFLNGMVFGGVFERHPGLTVLIAECGVHWFNGTIEHMQQRDSRQSVSAKLFFGDYRWSLSPEEFALRNLRVAPLPTPHQSPRGVLDRYPTCAVFASDYAHNEGHPSPLAYYDELLAGCSEPVREQFFGQSMADVFARMGHPLAERTPAAR
jgi:predicted TIM-barrel fold metal-dependent hydrolase